MAASGTQRTSGALTASGDIVYLDVDPAVRASMLVDLLGTFALTVTWELSRDNQLSWEAAPYAKRTSDKTTAKDTSAFNTAQDTFELVYPADVTHIRARCSAFTSGQANVTIRPGRKYVPGMVIKGLLAKTDSAANGAQDTGTLETAGWKRATFLAKSTTALLAANGLGVSAVDDAGNGDPFGTDDLYKSPAATAINTWVGCSFGDQGLAASVAQGNSKLNSVGFLPRRMRAKTAANGVGAVVTLWVEVER